MHQRARTDPSGGRGATRVPTGTQGNADLVSTARERLCPPCKMTLQVDWVRRVGKFPRAAPAIGVVQAIMKTLALALPTLRS